MDFNYSSLYSFYADLSIEERSAWVAIVFGSILLIIGLFMLFL